jgi:hypothetical protein
MKESAPLGLHRSKQGLFWKFQNNVLPACFSQTSVSALMFASGRTRLLRRRILFKQFVAMVLRFLLRAFSAKRGQELEQFRNLLLPASFTQRLRR